MLWHFLQRMYSDTSWFATNWITGSTKGDYCLEFSQLRSYCLPWLLWRSLPQKGRRLRKDRGYCFTSSTFYPKRKAAILDMLWQVYGKPSGSETMACISKTYYGLSYEIKSPEIRTCHPKKTWPGSFSEFVWCKSRQSGKLMQAMPQSVG